MKAMLRILFIIALFLQVIVSPAQADAVPDACHDTQAGVHAVVNGACDDAPDAKHNCDEGCLTCSTCHCGHSHWLPLHASFAVALAAKETRPAYTGLVYASVSPGPLLEPPSIV